MGYPKDWSTVVLLNVREPNGDLMGRQVRVQVSPGMGLTEADLATLRKYLGGGCRCKYVPPVIPPASMPAPASLPAPTPWRKGPPYTPWYEYVPSKWPYNFGDPILRDGWHRDGWHGGNYAGGDVETW